MIRLAQMKKEKIYAFLVVGIFLVIVFLISHNTPKQNPAETYKGLPSVNYVKIGGQSIKVEIALTAEEQTKGLSGRSGLKENEGMLFVFAQPDKYFFWMKDMNFAIDIIWIGENGKIIYIKKDARPESYPETYGPLGTSKYVLEVVSGFSEKNNLQIGDRVEFQ